MSILGNQGGPGARKLAVWSKGVQIVGYDPAIWRRDEHGNAIRYGDYGNRDSDYGWEIDHIFPSASGGSDALVNLRPLHWRANATRGRSVLGNLGNL